MIAFNSAKTMAVANCTFNWTDVDITTTATNPIVILNNKYTYISKCHENKVDGGKYKISGQTDAVEVKASTATPTEFKAFDAINIYYDNVLYYSINQTNAATVGFTPLTFFSGKMSPYSWETKTFE